MKLQQLLEQSKGQQVMTFAAYLQSKCPCAKANKQHLEDLGSYLFSHGWTYREGPSAGHFIKGNNNEGKFRLVVPMSHYQKPHNWMGLYYFKEHPDKNTLPGGTSRYRKFMIRPIEKMREELTTFEMECAQL